MFDELATISRPLRHFFVQTPALRWVLTVRNIASSWSKNERPKVNGDAHDVEWFCGVHQCIELGINPFPQKHTPRRLLPLFDLDLELP